MPDQPPVFRPLGSKSEAQRRADFDKQRGSAAKRGYDSKWAKARKDYLQGNPLCLRCRSLGIITAATVVDHIVPHKGDKLLFWDKSNWQPLCKRHHDQKTATEDSGFAPRNLE